MIAVLVASLLGVTGPSTDIEDAMESCIVVRGNPLYQGLGWSHFVELVNVCDVDFLCRVSTTIDPTPVHEVELAPGQTQLVRTRQGAPSPIFEPIVSCSRPTWGPPARQERGEGRNGGLGHAASRRWGDEVFLRRAQGGGWCSVAKSRSRIALGIRPSWANQR